jgi:hypothetical protein
MQRFFTVLLCFSVLLMLGGCATSNGGSSRLGQEPAPQAETKAAAPIPGTTATPATASIPGAAEICPVGSVTCPPGTAPAPQKTGPTAEVPEKLFDFGTMNEDRDYSHAFIIKNVGTSELTIKKVLPG